MTHNPDADITMPHGTDVIDTDATLWNADMVYTEAYLKQAIPEAVAKERERCAEICDKAAEDYCSPQYCASLIRAQS